MQWTIDQLISLMMYAYTFDFSNKYTKNRFGYVDYDKRMEIGLGHLAKKHYKIKHFS